MFDQFAGGRDGASRAAAEYPAGTAGRLLTTAFAAVSAGVTVAGALDTLREVASAARTINVIYVLGPGGTLAGVCSIRELLVSHHNQMIDAVMRRDVIAVDADTDQEEVARVVARHDFTAVPVVDGSRRLLGIVTVDTVVDVMRDEFNEDYATLVGSDAAEMSRRTPAEVARLRLPWLVGTVLIELGAGVIIARFDDVLRSMILLASFMPVISAVSGNVGLQSAAMVVRGLDTGHVSLEQWGRAVRRELATALVIAAVIGSLLGVVAAVWSRHLEFAFVVGTSMTCAIVAASVMGTLIPMVSKRLGFDPATTAGPFETALQDVIGFTVFLSMARLLAVTS